MKDPIIEELHRIRKEHAAEFNFDLDAIFADLKRFEAAIGRPRVSFQENQAEPRSSASTRDAETGAQHQSLQR